MVRPAEKQRDLGPKTKTRAYRGYSRSRECQRVAVAGVRRRARLADAKVSCAVRDAGAEVRAGRFRADQQWASSERYVRIQVQATAAFKHYKGAEKLGTDRGCCAECCAAGRPVDALAGAGHSRGPD